MGLVNDYQPVSNYLKAADIVGVQMVLTIKDIGEATFDDGKKQPTIGFKETDKTLGLNKTNREKLAELFGQPSALTGTLDVEPDDIIGQKICVYKTTTQDKSGATVPCVRIRAATAVKTAATTQFKQLYQPGPTKESAWAAVFAAAGKDRAKATLLWGAMIKQHNQNWSAILTTLEDLRQIKANAVPPPPPPPAPAHEEPPPDPTDLGISEENVPF